MIPYKRYEQIKDFLFLLICVSIIFDNVPKFLRFNFLGGPLGNQLGVYPIFFGLIFTCFCYYSGNIDLKNKKFLKYIILCFAVLILSTINGILIYPYYNQILHAPVVQFERFPNVYSALVNHNIPISQKELVGLWIIVRSVKNDIFTILYTLGFSYMIFIWYYGELRKCCKILRKGIIIGLIVFICYGFIDVAFQLGSGVAQNILEFINPILHPIAVDHDWWPPLLWKGQVRSVLSEPSRVGNYISFVLPFLFIPVLNRTRYWKGYLSFIFFTTYLVFMTKARTAVAMLFIIFFLTAVMLPVLKKKVLIKRFVYIILVAGIAFISSIFSIASLNPAGNNDDSINEEVHEYLADNIGSLASKDKRSNTARYALIKSNIKTGLEHPILGVGQLLNGAYTVAHFDEFDMTSGEVQKWIEDYYEQGPLKNNFDAMNAYITAFSTTGILGLICLISPFCYGVFTLFKKILACQVDDERVRLSCLLIALIASLVAGCNGSLTLIYAVWILLPIVYLVVFEDNSKKENFNESA